MSAASRSTGEPGAAPGPSLCRSPAASPSPTLLSAALLVLGAGVGCSGKGDTAGPVGTAGQDGETATDTATDTDEGESLRGDCPQGMVEIAAFTGDLGEGDPILQERYAGQQVLLRAFTLEAFCIDRFPFPGEGQAWTQDPLDWDRLEAFKGVAEAHGRRLCTVAELMLAAGGTENWRYPYDRLDYREGRCEVGDLTPSGPIGSFEECTSPLGVRDFMVRSTWAVLDDQAGEDIRAYYYTDTGLLIPGGGEYAVWGGSASQDTFYAPNNYGLHFYGPGDPGYVNESVRSCAAVGSGSAAADTAWQAVISDFVASGEGFASL